MLLDKKTKKNIFTEVKENGYAKIDNYFSFEQIDKVKKSLVEMLNYVYKDDKVTDLQKKYFQILEKNPKLKGNFYDLCKHETEILKLLNDDRTMDLVRGYFNTEVIFSSNPGILIYDDGNQRVLAPHQETNQFAKDFLFIWAPLYDAIGDQGGITIYENSHKHGYWQHHTNNKLGSTNVISEAASKFKKKKLEVEAGSALLVHSAMIHESVNTKKKGFARFVIIDRLCPLKQLPYLERADVPKKIPYPGHGEGGHTVDYNTKNIYLKN